MQLDRRSKYLRRLIVDALVGGKRGHVGSALSLVEIFRVLYDDILKYNPDNPEWSERDRCILSKGHGCLAQYVVLADKGFFPTEELKTFCHYNSRLGGHPERGYLPGIEVSTGALGHGLSVSVGLALALRMKNLKSRVFTIVGDGEINEGSIWEAALSAAKHKLNNLTVLVDYNKLQSYGPVEEVLNLEPLVDKWESFGFSVGEVDGHDICALQKILSQVPFSNTKPSLLICHTIKGCGFSSAEHNPTWHHKSRLKPEVVEQFLEELSS
jgi:transketolase